MRILLAALAALLSVVPTAALADWHEAKSRHFIIYAEMPEPELRAYAERLERFDQAVRKLRSMPDPELTDSQRLTIYALENEAAVGRLLGSDGTLGFYVTNASGSSAFVPRKEGWLAKRAEMSAETVFFHEYAHHLQLGSTSTALPAWLVEGFAEFFATAEITPDGSVRIGAPPTYREWAVQRYDGLSIHEMLGGTLRNISGEAWAVLYGRGWLLTHMLTFDPARKGQLQRYVTAMQQGIDPLRSAKAAFGEDLRDIDRALDGYLRQRAFRQLVISGDALTPGPITVRKLSPAEAGTMDLRIRLASVQTRKDSARLTADARRIARNFPNDPHVLTLLARAELGSRNWAAAEAAASQAVASDPKLASAALALGRARMELGRATPAQANWPETRSFFLKANKADPENAEPLMLFYRSYLYQGAAPTANAIKGLLYATALAPRDENLRIDAVRQLVSDGRMDEARKLFAYSAYHPHSEPKWRETKLAIMDALTKGDKAAALPLLEAEQKKRQEDEERGD